MAGVKVETKVWEKALGGGLLLGVYTVTVAAGGDWCVMDNYELIKFANAFKTADGTDQKAYLTASPNTDNKVFFATTGAATFMVLGTSIDSIGGAT